MGLDSVELVIEVEKTFGFSIPDDDVAALDTVGKLYDYILAHRFEGTEQGCLTSVAFYKLRRALMSVFGMARSDVRPSLEVAAIIPARRRRLWRDLQEAMGLRLPSLVRPLWVTILATTVGCALVVAAAVRVTAWVGVAGAVLLALFFMCVLTYVLDKGTEPLAVEFHPAFADVGGLTKSILRRNYGAISDACQRTSADEVWDTLRALIVEQLGVRLDDVTKEASFVKDLGVDH